jgi:hypothetical protein
MAKGAELESVTIKEAHMLTCVEGGGWREWGPLMCEVPCRVGGT